MDATLLRLFGTKLKAFTAVFSVLVLITLSQILQGTAWEYITFIMALIIPLLLLLPNMLNEPKEVQKKQGIDIMKVGLIMFVFGTVLQMLVK